MKQIIMARYVVHVDDEDFEELNRYNWRVLLCRSMNTYAMRHATKQEKGNGYPSNILMHRQILKVVLDRNIEIDHKDGDGLNNTRENLRNATRSQNNMNRVNKRSGTSKYKGVSWKCDKNKWEAYIRYENKKHRIGYFSNEIEAAIAYNNKAKDIFGEFACLNKL